MGSFSLGLVERLTTRHVEGMPTTVTWPTPANTGRFATPMFHFSDPAVMNCLALSTAPAFRGTPNAAAFATAFGALVQADPVGAAAVAFYAPCDVMAVRPPVNLPGLLTQAARANYAGAGSGGLIPNILARTKACGQPAPPPPPPTLPTP